jgi:hypothetical protein
VNTKHAAWSLLCQFEDRAPEPGDVKILLVQSDNEQIGFVFAEKANDRFDCGAFDGTWLVFRCLDLVPIVLGTCAAIASTGTRVR